MPGQTGDGGPVEKVAAVLQGAFEPVRSLGQRQGEVELGDARLDRQGKESDAGQLQPHTPRGVLEREHHLEERRAGEVALRRQLLHQALEGDVLVGHRAEGTAARAGEKRFERGVARAVRAQHEGVDEEADQVFNLDPVAAGDGSADGEVVLAGEAMEQRLEGGEQHHEQAGAPRARQGGGLVAQAAGQADLPEPAGRLAHGRTRPVGGQVERRGSGERLAPVFDLSRQCLAAQRLPLPAGEVRILDRQLRKRAARIKRGGLADQQADRPAVGDDVMHRHQDGVAPLSQPDQRGAEERSAGEVERPPRFVSGEPRQLGVPPGRGERGEVDARQGQIRLVNPLDRAGRSLSERGPQHRVAADDLTQRFFQSHLVQITVEAQRHRDVVKRRSRLQSIQEPEALLGEREWKRLARLDRARQHRQKTRCEIPAGEALVTERHGGLPGRLAQGVLGRQLAPAPGGARLDTAVLVELDVPEHTAFGVDAVGHPCLLLFVRIGHVLVIVDPQERARPSHLAFGVADEILEAHPVLALIGDVRQESGHVAMAHQPDQLGQGAAREAVRLAEEKLIELGLLEAADHPVRMADQVDIPGIRERRLGPLQDRRIERVGRRLVHQDATVQVFLEPAVEALGGPILGLGYIHQRLGFVGATPAGLHDGADHAFEPEAVAAGERRLALAHGIERQQLKLRRREQSRMPSEHDAQQRRARARRRQHEERRRVFLRERDRREGMDQTAKLGHRGFIDPDDLLAPSFLRHQRLRAPEADHGLPVLARQMSGHLRHGRRVENHHHVNDFTELALEPVDEHGAGDRVATQIEKRVVNTDRHAQRLAPQPREEALQRRARLHPLRFRNDRRSGLRQRLAVHLAVRAERHGVEEDEGGRDHVLGEGFAQPGAENLTP